MGGSYSDLNIYLRSKKGNGQSNGNGPTVTSTQKNFEGCCSFEVITHKIEYTKPATGLKYNILLYDGSSKEKKGNYVFGYYYPSNDNEAVKEVSNYYSVLAPNVPLVISFKCGDNTYNCDFGDLKRAGWDRAYNISKYSFRDELNKEYLIKRFQKLSLDRKIKFTIGRDNTEISGYRQILGDKIYFRLIFIPKGDESVLGSENLFSIDFYTGEPKLPGAPVSKKAAEICTRAQERAKQKPENGSHDDHTKSEIKYENRIDPYYLSPFNKQLYDGIMVYFARETEKSPKTLCAEKLDDNSTALLVEFIDSSKQKTHLKRKDHDGYCWSEEPVDYTDDASLLKALKKIRERELWADFITVILDEKTQYRGVKQFENPSKPTYTTYKYTFENFKKPVTIYRRKEVTISSSGLSTITAKIVEVYYLKVGNNQDKQPFLIIFDKDGKDENKKAFHFNNKEQFNEWVPFTFTDTKDPKKPLKDAALMKKLEEKLTRIENLTCLGNLSWLRYMAYLILTDPEVEATKPEEREPPQRPDEYKPPKQPEGLPIPLIIGCVVTGVIVIVTLVVVYGVYWYNTTIKLLT